MASEAHLPPDPGADAKPTSWLALLIAWTLVTAPLAWGVYMTALGAVKLFTS